MGYLNNLHYPCVQDMNRAVTVAFHSMLASSRAIKKFKGSKCNGEIGIILNLTPSYPRSNSVADLEASELADLFFNRSFLDPSVLGEYPERLVKFLGNYHLLPSVYDGDLETIANNTVDFLGVNYYKPRRVKEKEEHVEDNKAIMLMIF